MAATQNVQHKKPRFISFSYAVRSTV